MTGDDYWCDVADQAYAEFAAHEQLAKIFARFGVDYDQWARLFVDPSLE